MATCLPVIPSKEKKMNNIINKNDETLGLDTCIFATWGLSLVVGESTKLRSLVGSSAEIRPTVFDRVH